MENDTARSVEIQRLVYLSAERTLLSWIRTALGLMALGFEKLKDTDPGPGLFPAIAFSLLMAAAGVAVAGFLMAVKY